MEAMERYVKESKPLDWVVSLELISSKEASTIMKRRKICLDTKDG